MAEEKKAAGSTGRWVKVALAVSVGLNLAVAGLVVGAVLDRRGEDTRRPPANIAREIGLGPYFRALPPDAQRELGQKVRTQSRQQDGGWRGLRAAMRASFSEVLAELRSETFDVARFDELLGTQSGRLEARRVLGQQSLAQVVDGLTREERFAYADRLEQTLRRPRKPSR